MKRSYSVLILFLLLFSAVVLAGNITIEGDITILPVGTVSPEEQSPELSIFTTVLNLFLDKVSVISGELVRLRADLLYQNNSPIVSAPLDFYVGDTKVGTKQTDEDGSSVLEWDSSELPHGVYVVGVDYQGNGQAQPSHAEDQLTIQAPPVSITGAAITESQPSPIQEEKQCTTVSFEVQQPIMGSCTDTYPTTVCDDYPTNASCYETTEEVTHSCVTGYETVIKNKEECRTTALVINNHFAIPTINYACSTMEEGSIIIVTCDSKYDGDGNGECHSGESCLRYEIDGETISQTQRNSHDEFKESDGSFFQEENGLEVRQ